ncbi:T9SS type A sorting domain-containing protein [bacterium]|nr:T9SS type A sorting domain-containing protein [bacterium]
MRSLQHVMLTVVLLAALSLPLSAQVSLTTLSTASTQDFNTLINSGSGTWTDNSTITGWYHARTGSGNTIVANDGGSNAGNLYSYGTGTSTDRALGSVGSGNSAAGDFWWGVRLVNNTGSTITSLDISYYGEQWRYSGTAAVQTVEFSYQTGSSLTSLTSGSWTAVTALDFNSPISSGSTGSLDGNASANRTLVSTVLSVTLNPGDEIMLRWFDDNHSGSDHGLAVDDFSVTPYGSASAPTTVEFSTASSAFSEGAGTVNVTVSITNPDASNATTVDVAMTGNGTATNGNDCIPAYATQTLTFPAGSSADQSISLTLNDDVIFEGDETFEFELKNVSGGNNAAAGAQSMHTLTIQENDPPPSPDVLVNEYYNAYQNIATDEAVELYVAADGVDMRGWSISDATSGGSFPYATITFSNDALWSNLPAGTIIVLGGIYSVPIEDTDVSDGLIQVQVPASGNSNQYFTGHTGGTFAFAGSSDACAIMDASSTFVHGLAHGSNNQNTLPPGLHGWLNSSLSSGTSCYFARSGAPMVMSDFLENTYVDEGAASLAAANDADGNRDFLRFLRSRDITLNYNLAGTFYWNITVQNGATAAQTGAVSISNMLTIENGTWNTSGMALALHSAANAENGNGSGNLTVGDDVAGDAVLRLGPTFSVTGSFDANHDDATVVYESDAVTVYPATYFNLTMRSGQQKTIDGAVTVVGTLTIDAGAELLVNDPQVITLGASGLYANNGSFLGKIRSTRIFTGGTEAFGGIGITLFAQIINAPQSLVPGTVTVTMTSGEYIWVDNTPSILRYYEIEDSNPNLFPATMTVDYAPQDLNGQTESNLGLYKSTNSGSSWTSRTATLNTSANTLELDLDDIDGLWTMHASPPQAVIMTDPTSLYFETVENGPLPVSQLVDVWNDSGSGSILDWDAIAATMETPSWLSLTPSPAEGHNSGNFLANITRSDLAPGFYSGTITVTDPHAANDPVVIPVTYRVFEERKLSIGVDTLRIKVSYKRVSVAANIPVVNGGESFGPGEIAWTASSSTSWMTLSNTSGLEGDKLGIAISALTMMPGTYYGEITIEGVNNVTNVPIVNSPLTVPVVLENEPRDQVVHTVSSLPMGSGMSFYNAEGHIIARIDVNSGTVQNLSLRLVPYALPRNIQRLRYAYRHYILDAEGSYSADMTLYYTLSELGQTGIDQPELLRIWRQIPAQYSWVPYAGYSTPLMQSVTAFGLTDLDGIWAMAYPYFPEEWEVEVNAAWKNDHEARISFNTTMEGSGIGFILERSETGSGEWRTAAVLPPSTSGRYAFEEELPQGHYTYRVITFDSEGTALQSPDTELLPMSILGTGQLDAGSFALGVASPHPAPLTRGSAQLQFSLPQAGELMLALYDAAGREVATIASGQFSAGAHTVDIPLQGLSAGTYFYRLATRNGTLTRALVVTR